MASVASDESDPGPPVMRAARAGDLAEVKRLIDKGADPNEGDSVGETALFEAVFSTNLDIAAVLLLKRADPIQRSLSDAEPIDYADSPTIKTLIDIFKGKDVEERKEENLLKVLSESIRKDVKDYLEEAPARRALKEVRPKEVDQDFMLNFLTDYQELTVEYEAADASSVSTTVLGWSQGAQQTVWSEALPRTIAANLARMAGRRVLELGAGCGLLGLVAAHSAAEVVTTDGDVEEAALLRVNAQQHAPPGGGKVRGAHLDWGLEPAEAAAKSFGGKGSFDVILGSQICHNPKHIEELVETIAFFLSREGEAFIFNDRVSLMSTREACRELFDAALRKHGLRTEEGLQPEGPLRAPSGVKEELALREGAYLVRLVWA